MGGLIGFEKEILLYYGMVAPLVLVRRHELASYLGCYVSDW